MAEQSASQRNRMARANCVWPARHGCGCALSGNGHCKSNPTITAWCSRRSLASSAKGVADRRSGPQVRLSRELSNPRLQKWTSTRGEVLMNRYPASPQYLTAMHKYFGRFLASLSAMVAIAPLPLSASGILPTYDVDRILLVASASFLCMLAFGIVFHFRVEIATAMGYLGPYKGPDQLQ